MASAILVEHLFKEYRLGVINSGMFYRDLQDWFSRRLFAMRPHLDPANESSTRSGERFLALKDVNLEIEQGDRIGIVGKNGAGKSTLLKILSRITAPSRGIVKIRGRIASLLEVGTGFHPELTGRENIYLNGAILGMKRREIDGKLDEIIDFAGIEKFIDTPAKRYSSGMYVRLAFAVAAHLNSDILLADEVLAVGDAEFQNKSLGKMEKISAQEGRTIIFVSHNMAAVKKLCLKGVLLEQGEKETEGPVADVVDYYLNKNNSTRLLKPIEITEIGVVVDKIALNEELEGKVVPFQPLKISIELDAQRDLTGLGIQVMLSHSDTSGAVFSSNTKQTKNINVLIKKGRNRFICEIKHFMLCSGKYTLGFAIDVPFVRFYFHEMTVLSFDVDEVMQKNANLSTSPAYGHIYLDHDWITE